MYIAKNNCIVARTTVFFLKKSINVAGIVVSIYHQNIILQLQGEEPKIISIILEAGSHNINGYAE